MLKRLTNGEFVLAILGASLFWIAVLGWTTSYAPTDPQKDACYQSVAKSGHNVDECKSFWEKATSDPVAAFTCVLAISTVGLWIATIGLFFAGERQLKHMKMSGEQQLRAYIGIESCKVITRDWGNTFTVEVRIKNTGATPARDLHHHIAADIFTPFGERIEFTPPGRNMGIIPLAPGMTNVLETPIAIGGPAGVPSIQAARRAIFTWGRVNYWDVFGREQHMMFRFRSGEPIREHNGTVMETIGWHMTAEDQGNSAT
jgi:hypothetical protein